MTAQYKDNCSTEALFRRCGNFKNLFNIHRIAVAPEFFLIKLPLQTQKRECGTGVIHVYQIYIFLISKMFSEKH